MPLFHEYRVMDLNKSNNYYIDPSDCITLHTNVGTIRGFYQQGSDRRSFYTFKKVPYAKLPGIDRAANTNHRFLNPRPLDKLQPLENEFVVESESERKSKLPWVLWGENVGVPVHIGNGGCAHKFVSEDQLFLNIYCRRILFERAIAPQLKPVLVFIPTTQSYIHPGSTKTDFYNPTYFMRQDIVVVVVSYRSGVLGFLNTNTPNHGPVGNAGLKDIAMALQWVQDYIHRFYGDKSNVTLCGQGYGAAMVNFCMLNKKTHHLYHRVILQSGCALNSWAYSNNEKNEEMKLKLLQDHSFEDLQNMSLDELLSKTAGHAKLTFFTENKLPLYGPSKEDPHEDAFLTAHPWDILTSEDFKFPHPVIIGYNGLEGLPLITEKMLSPIEDHIIIYKQLSDGKMAKKPLKDLLRDYGIPPSIRDKFDAEIASNNASELMDFVTDAFYLRGIRALALKLSEQEDSNVYFYKFNGDTELNVVKKLYPKWSNWAGAVHGDELGYLFKTPGAPVLNKEVTPTIMTVWGNFIQNGDPNPVEAGHGSLEWSRYDKENETYLVFGQNYDDDVGDKRRAFESKVKVIYRPEKYRMQYWDEKFTEECLSHNAMMRFMQIAEEDQNGASTMKKLWDEIAAEHKPGCKVQGGASL